MNLKLDAKIALVTGAGSGIGARISAKLAEEGCTVYVTDLDAEAANVTAAGIGPAAHAMRMDVTKPADVQLRVQEIVERHGGIDILVNNAGILKTGSLLESSIEDWDEVCRANLSSVYYCSKAVLPTMLQKRCGKIINIASIAAERAGGIFGNVLYGTTKAGVVAFTKGFARELAPHNINVNAVAPGVVDTPMTREKLTPDVRKEVLARLPMHRLAEADDIANAVV